MATRALWSLVALLCASIGVVSYRYVLEIGPMPPLVRDNEFAQPWLVLHAGAAATALLLAPLQFLPRFRARCPSCHRWVGRTYVAACSFGGLSGFVLALGASTGPVSTMGFGALAIAWVIVTWLAWRAAVRRKFAEHRAWMIRSFALTLAAVTLRLYLPILELLPISFEDGYRAISFLSWVPNILAAELYVRNARLAPVAASL